MSDTYLTNALIFLLSTLTAFCTYILLCRFILQMLNVDFFNPVSQAIVRMTDPPLNPLRRLLPSSKKYDFAAFLIAFGSQLLHVALAALLYKSNINLYLSLSSSVNLFHSCEYKLKFILLNILTKV